MQTLRLTIEIAVDEDDIDAAQARDIITHIRQDSNPSLFIGNAEFAVIAASLE